jgi:hypothetical protein
MLDEKDRYTLQELIRGLPLSIREFSRVYKISEVTVARLRDGKPGLPGTINKLLMALSDVHGKRFTQSNVTGIRIRGDIESSLAA